MSKGPATHFSGPLLVGTTVAKEANYTVVIETDSGKTFTSYTDGVVFTLPSLAVGDTYTFINTANDGCNTLTISPAALDSITYKGDQTDDKDIINTKATSKRGDMVVLAALGTVTWTVTYAKGVWAKQA